VLLLLERGKAVSEGWGRGKMDWKKRRKAATVYDVNPFAPEKQLI
jgi:hypothetical protein